MGYLITHIAICLLFAQLLGLLLGWLLWGYLSRQRGQEVQTLRERLADMHLETQRLAAAAPEPQRVLAPPAGALIEGDLPDLPKAPVSFFHEEAPEPPVLAHAVTVPPVARDLEAEVKDARIQHLEQQVRELESTRDRLPLLQADLSDAIAGRRTAEARFQEARNDFEVRSSSLLAQIRDFENAAAEWDKVRDEFEREALARDKELAIVKAHLRDLQNSQRPQVAEPLQSAPSLSELAELRERYQKALKERDSLAAELNALRNGETHIDDSQILKSRVAELEDALRGKDARLKEQVTRIESLLWRVAELEPFAAAAPKMEEDLRRHESEIAGHMAMHTESSERIRSLQKRVAELESETAGADELKRAFAEHQSEMERLQQHHAQELAQLAQTMQQKDVLLADFAVAREQQAGFIAALQAKVADLEGTVERAAALEKSLADRTADMETLRQENAQQTDEWSQTLKQKQDLLAAYSATIHSLQARVEELEAAVPRVAVLENSLRERENEIQNLRQDHARQVGDLHQTLAAKDHLAAEQAAAADALQARLHELETASQRVALLEASLSDHQTEVLSLRQAHATALFSLQDLERELHTRRQEHASQVGDLNQALAQKDHLLAEQTAAACALQAHIQELTVAAERTAALETSLHSRENELRAVQDALRARDAEITRLTQAHDDQSAQFHYLQQQLADLSSRLSSHEQRLAELEPIAAKTPAIEQQLAEQEAAARNQLETLAGRHQAELTRLKVNSAQRIRRLRQSITNFKG